MLIANKKKEKEKVST